jgi:hypothetical protein
MAQYEAPRGEALVLSSEGLRRSRAADTLDVALLFPPTNGAGETHRKAWNEIDV